MQKIMTQSEKDRKERRGRLIVGIVLVGLMIMSTLGYSLLSGEDTSGRKVTYNSIDFYENGNGWQTLIEGNTFNFLYSPLEVEGIEVPSSVNLERFYNKPLYFDSDNPSLYYEIAQNLQYYVSKLDYACLNASDCGSELYPIKTCANNIIVIRSNNQTASITMQENCTFISGNEDILKAGDAFLYKILGVND